MTGRRWSDEEGLGWIDRARRLARLVWPFLACAAAVTVLMAMVIITGMAVRQRDDITRSAEQAATAAREAKASGETAARLLEQFRPCVLDDPSPAPACEREAHTTEQIQAAVADVGRNMADLINQALVLLRARGTVTAPARPRSTVTMPRVASPIGVPTTRPATTTTTCPRLPNGRCHP